MSAPTVSNLQSALDAAEIVWQGYGRLRQYEDKKPIHLAEELQGIRDEIRDIIFRDRSDVSADAARVAHVRTKITGAKALAQALIGDYVGGTLPADLDLIDGYLNPA
jgi:hypothetical protein